jgi:PAS domain S-box-containing protein
MPRPLPIRRFIARQIVIVTILPVALIVVLIWLVLLPQVRTSIGLQQQSLARTVAGEILAHLMGGERQLVALADVIVAGKGLTPEQLTTLLDAGCGEGELFETIYIVGEADNSIDHIGLARPSRSRREDLLDIDLSGRNLFKTALREVRTAWSKTFLSTVSRHLAVAVAVPLPGRVIIGEIRLDRLSKYISQLPVEAELQILVIDHEGRVVADSRQKRWGQQLKLATLTSVKGDASASRSLYLDGTHMVASMVDVKRLGWQVLVAQPQSMVFKHVRAMLLLAVVGLVVAMMISLAVTWFMAKRLQKIVRVFTDHAKSIAHGKYALEWPAARTIEYHELGENLRAMARQIRQRERQLRENERRLQELTNNVPVVVYQFRASPDHVYTSEFLSGKTVAIFGLEPNASFIDQFYQHIPEADKDRYLASVRKAIDAVSPWNYEGRFIRPDGETIWFSGHAVPREDGNDLVFYGVLLDISERRRWEKALKVSEHRYRSLFEEAPMMYMVTEFRDEEPTIKDVNNRFLDRLGYHREEVIGTPMVRYYTQASKREMLRKGGYLRAMRGEFQLTERDLMTREGQVVNTLVYAQPEYDEQGQVVGTRAMFTDNTDRKQAEEAVRHLRNYLSNIINSMPSVLVGVDREGRVTQWNKQAERITGLSLLEVHQQPLGAVFPRLIDVIEQIQTAIRDRRVIRKLKVPRRDEDGYHYEDIIIFPLVANGVEGAVIRVDDVTERVRLEELMIQNEKMLSIGGLAAGMAHEINNPLAGILQNADVLKNRLFADLPANRRAAAAAGIHLDALQQYLELRKLPEMLADIRDSGLRATTIVKNMLNFARQSDHTVSSHDICALLDQTINLVETDYDMKKRYDFKKIRIRKEYAATELYVPCEPSKMQQVFLNLFKNGAEAMSGIGATNPGKDRPASPQFIIRAKDDRQWVRVEIEDNGPGLDAKTRRSVFEPFFTTKPVGKGTGLGLSVSYFIVTEDHGGEMAVEAGDSGGARFIIRLPKSGKKDVSETLASASAQSSKDRAEIPFNR